MTTTASDGELKGQPWAFDLIASHVTAFHDAADNAVTRTCGRTRPSKPPVLEGRSSRAAIVVMQAAKHGQSHDLTRGRWRSAELRIGLGDFASALRWTGSVRSKQDVTIGSWRSYVFPHVHKRVDEIRKEFDWRILRAKG